MKVKELYKIIKESLKEILEEQGIPKLLDKGMNDPLKNEMSACPELTNYGEITIYLPDCQSTVIDDRFICCSSNNNNTTSTPDTNLFTLNTTFGITINVDGGPVGGGCYCPTGELGNCLGDGTAAISYNSGVSFNYTPNYGSGNTFTYYDFAAFATTSGGTQDISVYGYYEDSQESCVETIGGCPHPLSQADANGYGAYVPDSQGCPELDNNGNPTGNIYTSIPDSVGCCRFVGCGAMDAVPASPNIGMIIDGILTSPIPETTNPNTGITYPPLDTNEQMDYWIDDGSCAGTFPQVCTTEYVTINGNDYPTSDYTPYGTVQYSEMYSNVDVSGGACTIEVCADPDLANLVDNLNNATDSEGFSLTNFQIEEGVTAGGHFIVNDPQMCQLYVCQDPASVTYFNNWNGELSQLPNYDFWQIVPNSDACFVGDVEGCTDLEACNYNEFASVNMGCEYPPTGFDCNGNEIGACLNPSDNGNNYIGDIATELTIDDGSCEFNYCIYENDGTTFASTASDYICNIAPNLCVNNEPDFGIPGSFIDGVCTYPVYGCIDDTPSPNPNQQFLYTNYLDTNEVACNEDNSTCLPAIPSTILPIDQNNPIQEGDNCCCQYVPGCTDENSLNYNSSATLDDGTCVEAKYGCMNPGMENYDPTANINQIGQNNTSNPCYYTGCVDHGATNVWGESNTSPWENYVCINENTVTDQTEGSPTFGETKTIGEWLCNCGTNTPGYPINEIECNSNLMFDITLGTYIDPDVYNSVTNDPYSSQGYNYINNINGSCVGDMGIVGAGCYNDGTNIYYQNDGSGAYEATLSMFDPNSTSNDGSCQYSGCNEPYAINYFCVDNPGLCTSDISQFDPIGCDQDPSNYPDGLPTCLDAQYGELNIAAYGCVYQETYNCTSEGCQNPGDGTGQYNTLQQCEQTCKMCSKVVAKVCNSAPTKTFECLQIEGQLGDPDCNGNGYCVNDAFEIFEDIEYGTNASGQLVPIKVTQKIKNKYVVQSIENSISEAPLEQANTAKCFIPSDTDRPRDPERPIGDNWCGTDVDASGGDVSNPQAKVTIDCCSQEGYTVPFIILNSVYQNMCTTQGVLSTLDHLEYCEEQGMPSIPPCSYLPPDRDTERQPGPPPIDPTFSGDVGGTGGTPVLGCTNPSAYNYNPAASVDDGSCIDNINYGGDYVTTTGGYSILESKRNKLKSIIKNILKNQK